MSDVGANSKSLFQHLFFPMLGTNLRDVRGAKNMDNVNYSYRRQSLWIPSVSAHFLSGDTGSFCPGSSFPGCVHSEKPKKLHSKKFWLPLVRRAVSILFSIIKIVSTSGGRGRPGLLDKRFVSLI
jgi:hypothetical protein